MKRTLVALLAVSLFAAAATAQPYYVRGDFNGWGLDNQMTDDGDDSYSATIDMSGQTAGDSFQFKLASEDWSVNGPPQNAQLRYVDGSITFHFYPNQTDDGWLPPIAWSPHRVGWDPTTGFDIMGDMNGWDEGNPLRMVDEGNGLFSYEMVVDGVKQFKFRATDDWGINIGSTFEWNANNVEYDFGTGGLYRFELDVPHGRYRVLLVPEPASLLGLGLLGLLIRRR